MEQWENNYYISAIAGATNGSSLVVMSKGKIMFLLFFLGNSWLCSDNLLPHVQVQCMCNSLIKLASHFLISGLIKSGKRVFSSLQWPPLEVDGELSCLVVADLWSRSLALAYTLVISGLNFIGTLFLASYYKTKPFDGFYCCVSGC